MRYAIYQQYIILQYVCLYIVEVAVADASISHLLFSLLVQLTFCDVDWVIKNDYIGSAFFDASASAFIMPSLLLRANQEATVQSSSNNVRDTKEAIGGGGSRIGGDLHTQHMRNQYTHTSSDIDRVVDGNAGTAENSGGDSVPTATGYGLGPEWIAKSNMQSFLKHQDSNNTGTLAVRVMQVHWQCYCNFIFIMYVLIMHA